MRFLIGVIALAGCGSSIDAQQHLTTVCEASSEVTTQVNLVTLDLDVDPPKRALQVDVLTDGWLVDRKRAQSASELTDRVSQGIQNTKLLQDLEGNRTRPMSALVVADQSATSDRVLQTLAALQTSGVATAHLVVASKQPHVLPVYPDPGFAAELKTQLAGASPSERSTKAAQILSDEIALCPGAQEAFAAVATASPEHRCPLLAHGLGDALPTCLATSTSRVVTATHVISEPSTPTKLTQFSLELSAGGEALSLAGPLWSDAAKALSDRAGKPVNALPVPTAAE